MAAMILVFNARVERLLDTARRIRSVIATVAVSVLRFYENC